MERRIDLEFKNSHVCDHLVQCICKSSNLIQYSKPASPKKEKKEKVKREDSTEAHSPSIHSPLKVQDEVKGHKVKKPSSKMTLSKSNSGHGFSAVIGAMPNGKELKLRTNHPNARINESAMKRLNNRSNSHIHNNEISLPKLRTGRNKA